MVISDWLGSFRGDMRERRRCRRVAKRFSSAMQQPRGVEPLEPRQMLAAAIAASQMVEPGVPFRLELESDEVADEWTVDWGDGTVDRLPGTAVEAFHEFDGAGLRTIRAWAAAGSGGRAFEESGGVLAVEAEHFTELFDGSGFAAGSRWEAVGIGGPRDYLAAIPNIGRNVEESLTGPRADYRVRLDTAGTWYAWVLMKGDSAADDSVHLGLNGEAVTLGQGGVANSRGQ